MSDAQNDRHRPDPDDLLRQVQWEQASKSRGKLKIYLGYAAGVGKTYAMLDAAWTQKNAGVDVLIGYLEPHARPETMKLAVGLEQLPYLEVAHGNIKTK